MHAWEAIQKTLNYIDEHISEDIEIEELANIACLSVFYYQRLFARLVKSPVREYIKQRRLAQACGELKNKENRIIDVAVRYGFSSHESFTRAFKDTYGITPAHYRNSSIHLDHFDKPDLMLNYVMVNEGVPLISEGIVLEMNRKQLEQPVLFVGVKDYFPFVRGKMLGERPGVNSADDIWNNFFSLLPGIKHINGGLRLGVCYGGDAPAGYTTYFAGVQAEESDENASFDSFLLPAREYVICGFETDSPEQMGFAVGRAMKYTRTWLREHGLIADWFFPEMYYPAAAEGTYMEIWVPFKQRSK